MIAKLGLLLSTLILFNASFSVMQQRKSKHMQQGFETELSLPLDVIAEVLFGLLLAIISSIMLSTGDLKRIKLQAVYSE